MVWVCGVDHEAGVPLGADAGAVVLVGQVLHALEVERLDHALRPEVVLAAPRGGL